MNASVALVIAVGCLVAALWSAAEVTPFGIPRWSGRATLIVVVAVVSWGLGGLIEWAIGADGPARPAVFLGYLATGIGLAGVCLPAVGVSTPGGSMVGWLGVRGAAACRAMILALLAFVCWRTESVWLGTGPA